MASVTCCHSLIFKNETWNIQGVCQYQVVVLTYKPLPQSSVGSEMGQRTLVQASTYPDQPRISVCKVATLNKPSLPLENAFQTCVGLKFHPLLSQQKIMLKSNLLLQFELTRDIILQLGGREPI